MPKYAYECTECGHSFDIHQSFSDESLTVCPECEGKLRKVFGAVGVVFKGSGFYRTDSRASASIPASSTSDGNGSSGSGDSAGKSDSAAKSDSASSSKSDSAGSSSGGSSATKADSGSKAAAKAS